MTGTTQRRQTALLRELHRLLTALEALVITPADPIPPTDGLVGSRVRITTGSEADREGTITSRRGTQYWWIKLDDGTQIYRTARTLILVSTLRGDTPSPTTILPTQVTQLPDSN